jgi:glycosyltransferase involved in cell wall biosynthesis
VGSLVRILVLCTYFRPDLSAGSFKVTALVEDLRKAAPPGSSIDVITTLPNRYRSFTAEAPTHEQAGEVTIRRIDIGSHGNGMVDQSKAYMAFARQVLREVAGREYDVVFATSSRLMTATLGAMVARKTNAPLYLDIRDIFVDTIKDVLPGWAGPLFPPFLSPLERWTINRAQTVNLVSPGFARYFERRYPRQRFTYFTNGIDEEFLAAGAAVPADARAGSQPVEVLYAGNIGEGQGLHSIIPGLARALVGRVKFTVIGDGGRRAMLEAAVAGLSNVELRPPMQRAALIDAYRAADVLFLHLNDYEAFEKVLPSKVFEYGAMGKPVWAGVAGFSAEFVSGEIENSAVFPPCDVAAGVSAFERLRIGYTDRASFIRKYTRSEISRRMAEDIVRVGREALRVRSAPA